MVTVVLPEHQAVIPDPLAGFNSVGTAVPFQDSVLPSRIDVSLLNDGPLKVCVSADPSGAEDCRIFTKEGDPFLTINGASCPHDPTAVIANASGNVECASPAGRAVSLDGSGSTDSDSTPGTNDDIVAFDWFENYGLPNQASLGSGEILSATLALGAHAITLHVTDRTGLTSTAQVQIAVVDTVPPSIQVAMTPSTLWPPFHQMVSVQAVVIATDACSTPQVTLLSVTSSEPDDAPGGSDGQTVNDIQAAVPGTPDFQYFLRAERSASGSGRTYVATYRAVDGSGNPASASGQVLVPHDKAGVHDPIQITLRDNPRGTVVDWIDSGGSVDYSVLRGTLSQVRDTGASTDLGSVVCVESAVSVTTTEGSEDGTTPPVGEAFFYLVEFNLNGESTYGSDTAIKPRLPGPGACTAVQADTGSDKGGERTRSSR